MAPPTFTESVVFVVMAHGNHSVGVLLLILHEITTLEPFHFSLGFLLRQFLILADVREASEEALSIGDDIAVLIYSLSAVWRLVSTFSRCERSWNGKTLGSCFSVLLSLATVFFPRGFCYGSAKSLIWTCSADPEISQRASRQVLATLHSRCHLHRLMQLRLLEYLMKITSRWAPMTW
jgi:hypothetical protein